MVQPELKQTATDARLSVLGLPKGGWSSAARTAALARVQSLGLPSRRDEYWKYTRPDTLVAPRAPEATAFTTDETPVFGEIDRLKIVFVDGVFDVEASDDLTLEAVRIERSLEPQNPISIGPAIFTAHWNPMVRRRLHARWRR